VWIGIKNRSIKNGLVPLTERCPAHRSRKNGSKTWTGELLDALQDKALNLLLNKETNKHTGQKQYLTQRRDNIENSFSIAITQQDSLLADQMVHIRWCR